MKDELTINQNYVLRKGLDDQYSLYISLFKNVMNSHTSYSLF